MIEEWKDIPNYKGLYRVSSYGNVMSNHSGEWRMLKPFKRGRKHYLAVILTKDKKRTTISNHQLVAMAFMGHKRNGMVDIIDHIDDDVFNNHVSNLAVVDNRTNVCKGLKRRSSKYFGVGWCKGRSVWVAKISVKNRTVNLGRFDNEYDAHLAYQKALKEL